MIVNPIIYQTGGGGATGTVILSTLTVKTPADKLEYNPGNTFDPAGLVLQAQYTNGAVLDLTQGYSYTPSGPLTEEDTAITFSYTENGVTKTTTLGISVSSAISEFVFGVSWNYAESSTALTRLTKDSDPNGLVNVDITTEPSPAVGTGAGSSPFDDYAPWNGMEEYNIIDNAVSHKKGESGFSRTDYDTMVYIPEFYFKIEDDGTTRRFYVADKAKDGFTKHPGSGRYVGKYKTISGYYSKSGAAPLVSITRAAARTGSKARGDKWSQYDYATWCAVQLLFLVEFADWDSQSVVGQGNVNTGAVLNSGGTDSMYYHTGRAAGTDGKTAVQYRGIENPWGDGWEWIDGYNGSERLAYICTNPANYADDTSTNYTAAGVTLPSSNGYTKGLGMSSAFPWAYLPNASGGSKTTYIPDNVYSNTGWCTLVVGGGHSGTTGAGLWYFGANVASSSSNSNLGARLLYHP